MLKKTIITLFFIFVFSVNSHSAGTSNDNSKKLDNYEKAVTHVEWAKKYEKKGKTEKAQKRYKKAQELLIIANKKKPLQADTLNYLGFTTRKLGYFKKGEEFYLLGLQIDSNHKGINEYLGELYVVTNRISLAKERLEVLKSCGCEEYDELKEIIEGTKKSKY